jgi:hypothetical protein
VPFFDRFALPDAVFIRLLPQRQTPVTTLEKPCRGQLAASAPTALGPHMGDMISIIATLLAHFGGCCSFQVFNAIT